MTEEEVYLQIAERFLQSCEMHLREESHLQEVIGFESYHVFESIGGAYNAHYGKSIPRGHVKKLNLFVATVKRNRDKVNSRVVAALAMTLHGMRNKYLYPEDMGHTYKAPADQISMTDAKRLVRRVRGIVKAVRQVIT